MPRVRRQLSGLTTSSVSRLEFKEGAPMFRGNQTAEELI